MASAPSTRLLTAVSAPVTSSVFSPRRKDVTGLFQAKLTGTTPTCVLKIQGRVDSNAPWHTIATITEADLVVDSAYKKVDLFPEMRVDLTAIGGTTPVLSAWASE